MEVGEDKETSAIGLLSIRDSGTRVDNSDRGVGQDRTGWIGYGAVNRRGSSLRMDMNCPK